MTQYVMNFINYNLYYKDIFIKYKNTSNTLKKFTNDYNKNFWRMV